MNNKLIELMDKYNSLIDDMLNEFHEYGLLTNPGAVFVKSFGEVEIRGYKESQGDVEIPESGLAYARVADIKKLEDRIEKLESSMDNCAETCSILHKAISTI